MKKHQVDDLFRRRLANVEMKPSAGAWRKIEDKSQRKSRPVFWIWYAAASVLIAGVVGYSVFENQQIDKISPSGDGTEIALEKEKNSDNAVPEAFKEEIEKPIAVAAQVSDQTSKEKSGKPKSTIPAKVEKVEVIEDVVLKEEHLQNAKTENLAVVEPIIKYDKPEVNALSLNEHSTESLKASSQNEPGRTIVIEVETSEPKVSKLSKVFRQLKKARAGERVDWEEVGFNPKNLVAKVDDRLRSKDERTPDKNQNSRE